MNPVGALLLLVAGAIGAAAGLPAAVRLYRLLGPRGFALHAISALFILLGALPAVAVAGLWWVARADYLWAIRGPFPFSHLGSGPFWFGSGLMAVVTAAVAWSIALWLKVLAHSDTR